MNPLFNELNGPMSLVGQFNNFMQNPFAFLVQKQIDIPEQYRNNPQDAVNYLISTGRMNQNTFNSLHSRASQMGCKF